MKITKEDVDALVDYDPITGSLIWKERTAAAHSNEHRRNAWNGQWAGKPAGHCEANNGHMRLRINGHIVYARKAIYLKMTGKPPPGELVLLDGDKSNMRWSNIELKSRVKEIEEQNALARNKVYPGVVYDEYSGRWLAIINIAKFISIRLGSFLTAEDAIEERGRKMDLMGITGGAA